MCVMQLSHREQRSQGERLILRSLWSSYYGTDTKALVHWVVSHLILNCESNKKFKDIYKWWPKCISGQWCFNIIKWAIHYSTVNIILSLYYSSESICSIYCHRYTTNTWDTHGCFGCLTVAFKIVLHLTSTPPATKQVFFFVIVPKFLLNRHQSLICFHFRSHTVKMLVHYIDIDWHLC